MDAKNDKDKEKVKYGRIIGVIILVLVVVSLIIMAINSRKPEPLQLGELDKTVNGAAFVKVNELLIEQMSDNWLPNDLFWPTVFLDNMPNFQIGQLEVIRYNIRVLRDNLSRMRTTDKLDRWAEGAFTALSNDPYKWWFPSAESRWQKAYKDLQGYYQGLKNGTSFFYPRADNLVELLNQYASLMGGVNTRLINAPQRKGTVLPATEDAGKPSAGDEVVQIDIPWRQIDDNFYYAQGVAYALHEAFKAIRIDFYEVLDRKNSLKLIDKITELLARCQFEPWIVFNGSPDSIFANHSLNVSGVFNDARQKIYSLTVALQQG
ncbi:MAG TPA: DUF2333 family protein [Desulfobacteraceae bacterium]|nr:DUF2333 family protein [Desulfobacteraceae bacterium]